MNWITLEKQKARLVYSLALLGASMMATAQSFTTINDPSAVYRTHANGISGTNIAGYYYDAAHSVHGFIYNGMTYQNLDHPLAKIAYNSGTYANGIDGTNIVGYYIDTNFNAHGFLYNGSTYSTLDNPLGVNGTYIEGISGTNMAGFFKDSFGNIHGFFYNGITYATLDFPSAIYTVAMGISGTNIVGYYADSSGVSHGFLYRGGIYTTLDDPLSNPVTSSGTWANGVDGTNIVGYYIDSSNITHGFLFNGVTYTNLDDPLATNGCVAQGIAGNYVVGYFNLGASPSLGFVATLPGLTVTQPFLSCGAGGGAFHLAFTNSTGLNFRVLASTNAALPAVGWTSIGTALESPIGSGQYLFTDTLTNAQNYYRVATP